MPRDPIVIDPPPETPTWGQKDVLGLQPDDEGENADEDEES